MTLKMVEGGIDIEKHHHEVATGGQVEFGMRFNTLLKQADSVMMYKYIAKNVAIQNGYTVTFMPKPLFQDNGSGMHVHQSLWKGDTNKFFDAKGYGMISQLCKYYIGGLLYHSPSLLAIVAHRPPFLPQTGAGYEAPINWSILSGTEALRFVSRFIQRVPRARELSTAVRMQLQSLSRLPCNACWRDWMELRTRLTGHPIDKDIYELEPEEKAKIKSTPGSLGEVLDALKKDHRIILLQGNVFTEDLIDT